MSTNDLVLLAYIFLIVPAMLVGYFFARRKMFEPYHKITMTVITIVNWLLIIFVMLVTYRYVIPEIPAHLTNQANVLIPTNSVADESGTPTSKGLVVRFEAVALG